MTKRHIQFKKDHIFAIKRKIISKLNELEKQGCIDSKLKHQLYQTSEYLPCFYGSPKIHKNNVPLRSLLLALVLLLMAAKFLVFILRHFVVGNAKHNDKIPFDLAKKITGLL